ncbi:unnamed protein product, partial [Rotaria magnacalcarata]
MNADLIENHLNIDKLTDSSDENLNIFTNGRFPNGSFSVIDFSQLTSDGSVEVM